MSRFPTIGLIAMISLLAACVPLEDGPVITAPILSDNTTTDEAGVDERGADEVIIIDGAAVVNEAEEEMVIIITPEEPVAPPPAITEPVITEPAITEPAIIEPVIIEPVITPFNPTILIGKSLSHLRATLGAQDNSFDNGGLTVHHYRGTVCLMLAFHGDDEMITHIDLRHPIIGKPLNKQACYQEFGARINAQP